MTLKEAAYSTHVTLHCDPIKKSAKSIEHEISLHIYNVLPQLS